MTLFPTSDPLLALHHSELFNRNKDFARENDPPKGVHQFRVLVPTDHVFPLEHINRLLPLGEDAQFLAQVDLPDDVGLLVEALDANFEQPVEDLGAGLPLPNLPDVLLELLPRLVVLGLATIWLYLVRVEVGLRLAVEVQVEGLVVLGREVLLGVEVDHLVLGPLLGPLPRNRHCVFPGLVFAAVLMEILVGRNCLFFLLFFVLFFLLLLARGFFFGGHPLELTDEVDVLVVVALYRVGRGDQVLETGFLGRVPRGWLVPVSFRKVHAVGRPELARGPGTHPPEVGGHTTVHGGHLVGPASHQMAEFQLLPDLEEPPHLHLVYFFDQILAGEAQENGPAQFESAFSVIQVFFVSFSLFLFYFGRLPFQFRRPLARTISFESSGSLLLCIRPFFFIGTFGIKVPIFNPFLMDIILLGDLVWLFFFLGVLPLPVPPRKARDFLVFTLLW